MLLQRSIWSADEGTSMSTLDVVAIVQAFHANLNERNVQALLELAAENVRIGGPR
jgi:hypothetical protein